MSIWLTHEITKIINLKSWLRYNHTFLNYQSLVTLDYYGKLDNYGNIFELNRYYKNKESYLKNLKEETPYQEEILELYKKNSNK